MDSLLKTEYIVLDYSFLLDPSTSISPKSNLTCIIHLFAIKRLYGHTGGSWVHLTELNYKRNSQSHPWPRCFSPVPFLYSFTSEREAKETESPLTNLCFLYKYFYTIIYSIIPSTYFLYPL
jgi:hypothetical protein